MQRLVGYLGTGQPASLSAAALAVGTVLSDGKCAQPPTPPLTLLPPPEAASKTPNISFKVDNEDRVMVGSKRSAEQTGLEDSSDLRRVRALVEEESRQVRNPSASPHCDHVQEV